MGNWVAQQVTTLKTFGGGFFLWGSENKERVWNHHGETLRVGWGSPQKVSVASGGGCREPRHSERVSVSCWKNCKPGSGDPGERSDAEML